MRCEMWASHEVICHDTNARITITSIYFKIAFVTGCLPSSRSKCKEIRPTLDTVNTIAGPPNHRGAPLFGGAPLI